MTSPAHPRPPHYVEHDEPLVLLLTVLVLVLLCVLTAAIIVAGVS